MDIKVNFLIENNEYEPNKLDIHSIMLANRSAKRLRFDVARESDQVDGILDGLLPGPNEAFKIISGRFGFSSCGIIEYVCRKVVVEELLCTTFRIGKKQIDALDRLHQDGRLGKAVFVTSGLNERDGGKYDYFGSANEICERNGWELRTAPNHSKFILMRTKNDRFVVETSSNLNENPKIEQFSFENNYELFEFYKSVIDEMR